MTDALGECLDRYQPSSELEAADLARARLLAANGNAWDRARPLHLTASAVIVHPPTGRVLLRWHERQQAWLQVGGHADPGETDPFAVARREAEEESGLRDLVAYPAGGEPTLIHVAIVAVTAGKGEPAHEHADLRFVLATTTPDDAVAESPEAPLRWLDLATAGELAGADNLRVTLARVAPLMVPHRQPKSD